MNIFKAKKNTGTFNGSGNNGDEARQNAEIKYQSWCTTMKKEGKVVKEHSREYKTRQLNGVYWRCELQVNYDFE